MLQSSVRMVHVCCLLHCRSSLPNNYIFKFSDDTVILSLLRGDESTVGYIQEINNFNTVCGNSHLILNTTKTKEMIFDPRNVRLHDPVVIGNMQIEQVSSYKYLGVHMDNLLKWNVHVNSTFALSA